MKPPYRGRVTGVASAPVLRHGTAVCRGIGLALFLAVTLTGCSANKSGAAERKAAAGVPVVVASVVKKTVPLRIESIGNVEPFATVSVKSRVDGQIVKVFFTDGQDVSKGQPLFQLDPRPFEAQLKQTEATLARDQAQLEHARAQEKRYRDLLKKNFISKDAFAQFRTNVETADATVRADQAAIENARLQLEYSTIRSPIDGRTGRIMIQLGNLVKANDTVALVVINQVSPVYVTFSVPEQYLSEIRKYMKEGSLPVQARLSETGDNAIEGKLAFIDNTVDTTTGTVKLRAIFGNADRALWPGQFVTAVLTLHEQRDAIVVPSQAVQSGPARQYVYVVNPDLTAAVREITVDRTEGAETVVAKGLKPGERVVITGQLRLVPGIKVVPKTDRTAS